MSDESINQASESKSEFVEIVSDKVQLLRQVHPDFCHENRPSSQMFKPRKNDKGLTSVDNSTKATSAESYKHYTEKLGLQSAGVWSVTIQECGGVGLKSYDSPVTVEPVNPAHAHIDFNGHSNSVTETKAKRLADFARTRGKLHP